MRIFDDINPEDFDSPKVLAISILNTYYQYKELNEFDRSEIKKICGDFVTTHNCIS